MYTSTNNLFSELLQAVWNVVKQISQCKAPGTFDQTYAILCGLADFFSSPGNYILFDKAEFWKIIQRGLVLTDPLSRKRTVYLLKRALDLLDKQPCNLSVKSEECCIFYWATEEKESLRSLWQDYILLMETLDEKQVLNFVYFFCLLFVSFGEHAITLSLPKVPKSKFKTNIRFHFAKYQNINSTM